MQCQSLYRDNSLDRVSSGDNLHEMLEKRTIPSNCRLLNRPESG